MQKWEFSCTETLVGEVLADVKTHLQLLGQEGWEPIYFQFLPSPIQGAQGKMLVFSKREYSTIDNPIQLSKWDFCCTEVFGQNINDLMGHLHSLGQEGWTPIYFNYINSIIHGGTGKMFVFSKRPVTAEETETLTQ